MNISISLSAKSRIAEVPFDNLHLGKYFSDHMLVADFTDGKWQQPQIIPYGDIAMSPALSALHYGQSIFEGLKVYKNKLDEIIFFRTHDNWKRLNTSAERMCMPLVPENIFMDGLRKLVEIDQQWIPNDDDKSLYVRPLYFATDNTLGVRPSDNYRFVIITSPSAPYYTKALKVLIEREFARSSEGGVGYAKAAGNYGGAMYPTKLAQQKGYDQLIWTDAIHNKYVEESGSMNVFFVISNVLLTPSLSHSKLAGITRDSILKIAQDWKMKVEERNISVDEIIQACKNGTIQEAFGAGTAANIAPICLIGCDGADYNLPALDATAFANRVNAELNNVKKGIVANAHNWIEKLQQDKNAVKV